MTTFEDTVRTILDRTTDRLTAEPERAAIRYRAEGGCDAGMRCEVRVGKHTMVVDEPPSVGGTGTAPNPLETALGALLSCQAITYRLWAAKLGIPLDAVTIDVEGDLDMRSFFGLDDEVRAGFGAVSVRVQLAGPADPERYRALRAAVDAHCPVLDVFRGTVPVETSLV